MPKEIKVWTVNGQRLDAVADHRLDLESRLEDWLFADIGLLDRSLLVIGRQVATDFGGSIDILCLDHNADVVVVELKRDRTPREVTAQLLDYASWVADLSAEQVGELAERHLGSGRTLDEAFRGKFGDDLPDVINENHRLLVVGSTIDPASERIIKYLSERHGVSINAVTFQYFRLPSGEELVGRVHLLEPEQVAEKVRRKGTSKRRPALSLEELEAIADERGVGAIYREAAAILQPLFNYTQTTRSSLRLAAAFEEGTGAVLNLIPTQAENGALPYQLYTQRAAIRFARAHDEIAAALPPGSEPWEYSAGAEAWWSGHAGVLRSRQDCLTLRRALTGNGSHPDGEFPVHEG